MCNDCVNLFPYNITLSNELFLRLANNCYHTKLLNCEQLLFNPFELSYERNTDHYDDYDPDIHYYSKCQSMGEVCESKYFDSIEFNKISAMPKFNKNYLYCMPI